MPNLTDLSTLKQLCSKYGFSFSKGFGQNFIINPSVCPRICEEAGVTSETNVLEIGPGFGTLTWELAKRAKKVVAVELDQRLLPVLEETLGEYSNVKIINQDVLHCDLASLIEEEFDGPVMVCANLPYYITSPILMKLLEDRLPVDCITVMVQKEAGDRLTAQPGTRQAGAISYTVDYFAKAASLFSVKPGSFYPAPKVTSSVIQLQLRETLLLEDDPQREKQLFKLIRAAFSQRRKTLANAASAGLQLPKQQLTQAIEAAGLPPLVRPEQLTVEDFITLVKQIWPETNA